MISRVLVSLTFVLLFSTKIFSQDTSGPVLSAFSQDVNTVDLTSGGVTITIQITVTDSSAIASVSSTPSLTLSSGNTSITSGYQNFSLGYAYDTFGDDQLSGLNFKAHEIGIRFKLGSQTEASVAEEPPAE